jgi:DNA-binding winged helix-turn-helix (wHTH) protein
MSGWLTCELGRLAAADERSSTLLYSFEGFSLDTARRELRRGRALVPLQPQVFDLLEYVIRNPERVVSKDDLLAAVWNGRIVSESTLSTRINAARNAIGDSGEEQRLIRTAHGKGIRFVGAVREEEETVRKLAAIFAADVAGYSRLMGQDEIGGKVVSRGRYVTFQMAAVAVSRQMFADIMSLIARLRAPPAPAREARGQMCEGDDGRGAP